MCILSVEMEKMGLCRAEHNRACPTHTTSTQRLVAASSRHNPSHHSCCLARTHACALCSISHPSSHVCSRPCTHASSMLNTGWPRTHCRLGSNCQSFWDAVDKQWKPEGQEQLTTMTDLRMIGRAPDAWGQKRLCNGLMKRHGGWMKMCAMSVNAGGGGGSRSTREGCVAARAMVCMLLSMASAPRSNIWLRGGHGVCVCGGRGRGSIRHTRELEGIKQHHVWCDEEVT